MQTNVLRFMLAVFALGLLCLSIVNVFGTMTPIADRNQAIADTLSGITALPIGSRMAKLTDLRQQQDALLAKNPDEPFAWARLSYLRLATGSDPKSAFAALRLSDFVSPNEPRQLPERAVMWQLLRDAETPDEQAYQAELWQKAFAMEPDKTWTLALQNRLDVEAGNALKARAPDLYEEWKVREQSNVKPIPPAL